MPTMQSKLVSRTIWLEKKKIWKINIQKNGIRKSFYSSTPGDKGRKICAQNAASWLSGSCPFAVSDHTTVETVFERYLKDKELETTNIYTIRNRYNNHIKPIIGKIPVMLLTKQDLKRVIYTAYRKCDLSQKSLKNIRGDLSGFCNYLDLSDIRNDLRTNNIRIPSTAKKGKKQALDVVSLDILFSESQAPYNGTVCQDSLMSDEEGKEETYHTHLYLVFCNAVMFKTLKNKFPTAHIEVPQWGTNSENYAYIRKEGTKYHKDANGHYEYTDAQGKVHVGTNFSDTFEESGDLPPDAKQGDSDTKIVLGINAAGIPVCIDFGQLPHWLLAAATGMGKTQLVLLILHQLTQKGYVIYLADYKGVDFGSEYRKPGHYADNDADLEQMLDSVVRELNRRRTEFSIAGCANLEEYVRTTGDDLHRIVVILDETSMILDTTGRDKEGKAAISVITNKLLAIGRLGRALGIHLLVATQRPDVGSVPGSLKAQLDGRICGHTADAQSSIVILDDGSAANLPAIPGRFIIRNGSETDDIVQAYYYHK